MYPPSEPNPDHESESPSEPDGPAAAPGGEAAGSDPDGVTRPATGRAAQSGESAGESAGESPGELPEEEAVEQTTAVPTDSSDPNQTSAMKTQRQLVFGGFPIEEKIGEGGMGVVYRAFDPDLQRRVAIKRIHPRLAGDELLAEQFTKEARSIAAVSHSNIAQIFAIHARDAETPPFFVMEFVDGPSVEKIVVDGGPCTPARAVEITLQAARGLRAAHLQGLIHRDVKPSNLLTTLRGETKLVDFGLAGRPEESHQTDGVVFGTPHYVAPEQARGWAVDHRADIYSLGCTLFFMLTGSELFKGKKRGDLVAAHCNEPPPAPGDKGVETPAALDAILARMLAKRPEERFTDYDELVGSLQSLLQQLTGRAVPPETAPARPFPWGIVAMVVVSIAIGVLAPTFLRGRDFDPADYFGASYVHADGARGEGLHYRFDRPEVFPAAQRTRFWTFPDVGQAHDNCRPPFLPPDSRRFEWRNYGERVQLPAFDRFDEIELVGLRFFGRPDFEVTIGADPDQLGSGLRFFFRVGAPNHHILECWSGGERFDSLRTKKSFLDFTIQDTQEHRLWISRKKVHADGKVDYELAIYQRIGEGGRDQEKVRTTFTIPAECDPRGHVVFRTACLKPGTWTVSFREILVRGKLDRARIQREF